MDEKQLVEQAKFKATSEQTEYDLRSRLRSEQETVKFYTIWAGQKFRWTGGEVVSVSMNIFPKKRFLVQWQCSNNGHKWLDIDYGTDTERTRNGHGTDCKYVSIHETDTFHKPYMLEAFAKMLRAEGYTVTKSGERVKEGET